MYRNAVLLPFLIMISSCVPSEADYFEAIEDHWPNVQNDWLRKAEFAEGHAAAFQKGADLSKRVSKNLGVGDTSGSSLEIVEENTQKAEEARWASTSKPVSLTDLRCVLAEGLPGEVCEVRLQVRGTDGNKMDIDALWRFDEVRGELTIVG